MILRRKTDKWLSLLNVSNKLLCFSIGNMDLGAGERKQITLSCIMDGFEGNETSTTDWTSDFNDTQITKSDLVIRNSLSSKMAFWNATIDIDWKDSGSKVKLLKF